jgi:hypothetical protein
MREWLFFFLFLSSSLFAKENDFLFVGFDAGETNIWVQVLRSWENAPDAKMLTMATATKVAQEAAFKPLTIESLGVSCPANHRLYEFSAADLQKIDPLPTSVLITGMYSTPQRQIAELFHKKGSKVIAVWDNFSNFDKLPKDLVANVEKIVRVAHAVLVPSFDIAEDLNTRFNMGKAIALGQPTLDLWTNKIAEVDKTAALAKTPFRHGIPILTYIGGYEEKGNGYCDSFITFVQSVNVLKIPVQIIIQLHPRSDGSFEKKILDNYASHNPQFPSYFVSHGQQLSTFEAVALASLGICHRSTVAIQGLFAGKRFLHIDQSNTPFSHFAIEKQLMTQCVSVEETVRYLSEHLGDTIDLSDLYTKGRIPPDATKSYQTFFNSLIKSTKDSNSEKSY